MSDTEQAVQTIFEGMPSRLNENVAKGMDAVIQYDLSGDGGGQYHSTIKDCSCAIETGKHDNPDMTVSMAASDFVDMIEGRLDGMAAFMSGKLRIGGDMGLAMKLQNLFS